MFDERIKEALLRRLPHPLVVCGCVDEAGEATAFTLAWITQTSFDPPVVAIAVRRNSSSNQFIRSSNVFSINFLGVSQADIAEHFMQPRSDSAGKLEAHSFSRGVTGSPILDESQGAFECNVIHIMEHGDHDVGGGEVIATIGREDMEEQFLLSHTSWQYGG